MIDFNEIISIGEETLYFAFTEVFISQGTKLYVTINREKKFYVFNMQKDADGTWKISEDVAAWIKELEAQLSAIIVRNNPAI